MGILGEAHCIVYIFSIAKTSEGVFMFKNKTFRCDSQQLPLLELVKNGWQVPQYFHQLSVTPQPLSTKEVMKIIQLESPTLLYRARQENSAYWHKTGDINQSKIVVPLGMRNKWMVFVPQNI
jgi:hypothetical protein